ncbi:hypothetical protein MRQ36_27965 [Micromonospora sp. R77]|uniref:hypothetical protein n=1 Tax=Micromonospora sp. R77 TaxID=2925836 RepID=UPI001F61D1E2|nr:hypothetical protein [Micromonospora sp. R77]MCI4066178.1 hypothetical protein [Micromonospora sp. R77]
MSDYLDVLRHHTGKEGYVLHPDELDECCARYPDVVCALFAAACTIAAADAQIAMLNRAANLLCDVHADGDIHHVLSLRERLDRVADALIRALAWRDKATARLRQACDALTDLGTGLLTRSGDHTPAADQPGGGTPATP